MRRRCCEPPFVSCPRLGAANVDRPSATRWLRILALSPKQQRSDSRESSESIFLRGASCPYWLWVASHWTLWKVQMEKWTAHLAAQRRISPVQEVFARP